MLSIRVLTALIVSPLFLAVSYVGGAVLLAALVILAVLGMREFNQIAAAAGLKPIATLGYLAALGWLGGLYGVSLRVVDDFAVYSFIPFAVLLVAASVMLWRYPRYSLPDLAVTSLGAFYVGGLLGYLLLLRHLGGWWGLLLALLLTWASDTGAYFAGRWWGKHQLAAAISPKKTWEGFAGGILMSTLVGLALAERCGLPRGLGALLGVLTALAAVAGDLTESALKRMAGVKDSGTLLPGHGGVLDRFDSLLFAAPLVYYFLRWFIID